jgi:integrase/recombinase XerD
LRRCKPWFRKSRNAWFVEKGGRQHILGKHPKVAPPPKKIKGEWKPPLEILDAFYNLMARDPANLHQPCRLSVAAVCDLFLLYSEKHNMPELFRWYRYFLQSFCNQFGRLSALDVKPFHVTQWLDDNPSWTTGRRNVVICLKRAFNWCEAEGILPVNPVKKVRKPPAKARDRILSEEERTQVLTAIKDQQFRDFDFALTETGCRPGEVRRITAADVNLEQGVWILHEHKNRKKTGKPRIVYLTKGMIQLTRRLMAKHPAGSLFRGPRLGRPFTANAIRCRFRELRKKLPHLQGVVAYCYRHSYATDALASGESPAVIAELMGHTDIQMLQSHYGHLSQMTAQLKQAAERIRECAPDFPKSA